MSDDETKAEVEAYQIEFGASGMAVHMAEGGAAGASAAVELGVVSRTLGHADLARTADIYAHLTPAMLDRTAARMDAILGQRKGAASA